MSVFSKLTPEQKTLLVNCKTREEMSATIKSFGILADDQAAAASGAAVITACPHGSDWSMKKCFVCPNAKRCPFI